jgi:cystathionine beta-lyase
MRPFSTNPQRTMATDKNFSDKIDTILTVAGRDPGSNHGVVNPPVYHASTIIFPSLAEQEKASHDPLNHITYGRSGTPTQHALEEVMSQLEGAHRTVAVPSGLAAITGAIFPFVSAGDHMLVSDSAYGPTRRFALNILKRFGVETTFFDPMMGEEIERLMRPNTKVVYVEAPGSLTFEVQDIPALAKVAHKHGAIVVADNTWATPVYCQPIKLGADIVVHAGTKYVVGHSDAMMGLICCSNAEQYAAVKNTSAMLGFHAAPDDCYLALRGLRTIAVRLRRHEQSALEIARWLKTRPEVAKVLHPALPDCPGHEIWKRDFTGSSGLFAFILKDGYSKPSIAAFVDHMKLFGIGYSWGGYESLMIHAHPEVFRTAQPWPTEKTVIRVHIGLDDVDDIKTDLAAGFDRMAKAMKTAAE